MATITTKYEQAKKDYEYLEAHHGAGLNDFTGGYVADEKYMELLRNPTKKNATNHYESMITAFSQVGYEPGNKPDFDDEGVLDIFRRHSCESDIMAFWGIDITEQGSEEE
ncbi:hypothetical protein VFMJ11_B0183 (plasmid) [Aliivibrio fischeri MJ11]|uniref:Uncharacterized protein n=1 Tax=Aliivibrio fischeri (strain MJ11) TaxID=388396 RepID=B5EWC6_ALIFM|nr:hypothetical protein [Aliivibrio fischeri]ACH64658.1 hypothetical protein VFMJ11_B0183 [Aliivibrio fischeri MJ11]